MDHLRTAEDLIAAVESFGFLPFFRSAIPGFSVEELCAPELWFAPDADGPWEWKGPAARSGRCLYGKLYRKKAAFVSREWLPDLANLRRDGYDFDARYDDGLASRKNKDLYDAIAQGPILSKELKKRLGDPKGFETGITRLQMQCYICAADFVYLRDKHGTPYGWGVAKYAAPEALFGEEFVTSAYVREPRESLERLTRQLSRMLPGIPPEQLAVFLKG